MGPIVHDVNHAYRSADDHILRRRVADLARDRELLRPLAAEVDAALASRTARILAGVVGVGGAVVTVVFASVHQRDAIATYTLLGSGGAAVLTYVLVAALFRVRSPERLLGQPLGELPRAPLAEALEWLDEQHPMPRLEARVARWEAASIAWPMSAISLLAPLTLHWLVSLFMNATARDFSEWILISSVVVGLAHLTLVGACIVHAYKVRKMSLDELRTSSPNRPWVVAYCAAILASCLPGVLFLGVPPLISIVTGLAFIPPMFRWMRSNVLRERGAVEAAYLALAEAGPVARPVLRGALSAVLSKPPIPSAEPAVAPLR